MSEPHHSDDTSKVDPAQKLGADELERVLAEAGCATKRSATRALSDLLHTHHLDWNVLNVADDQGHGPDGLKRAGGMRTITITLQRCPDAEEEPE